MLPFRAGALTRPPSSTNHPIRAIDLEGCTPPQLDDHDVRVDCTARGIRCSTLTTVDNRSWTLTTPPRHPGKSETPCFPGGLSFLIPLEIRCSIQLSYGGPAAESSPFYPIPWPPPG